MSLKYKGKTIGGSGPQGEQGPAGADATINGRNTINIEAGENVDLAWEGSTLKITAKPYSNPNLLDNWYFIGGGSQQGGGQFPINQRGQTSYTAGVYTIDRWKFSLKNCTGAVSLLNEGLKITASTASGNVYFTQQFDNFEQFLGKKVTVSMLYDDQLFSHTAVFPSSAPSNNTNIYTVHDGKLSLELWIFPQSHAFSVQFNTRDTTQVIPKAAKLELGSQQTLAHQENGEWVLNDPPPNYATELLKCWRYLQPVVFIGDRGGVDSRYRILSANHQLPVKMRANPTALNPECILYAQYLQAVWKKDYANLDINLSEEHVFISVTLPETFTGNIMECCVFTQQIINGVGQNGKFGPLWLSADL